MKIVYASTGSDLVKIKQYGFDAVCGYFTIDELDMMWKLQIGCIYHGTEVDHPAIIAYYLYDEPDYNKVPIEQQEGLIAKYRLYTNKPLAIACVEQTKRLCSPNFDWYMLDIYYFTALGRFSKLINYLNIALSTHMVMVLYKGKKILPIMGLFDDQEFKYTEESFKFAKKFRSYFRDEPDQAIFIWSGDAVRYWGIIDRKRYEQDALCLNCKMEPERCWWITSKCLMGAAYVITTIRRWIKDEWIVKVNSWLPDNLKMKL